MDTMTLDQFRGAFQAGSFSSVGVAASGGVFLIVAEPRSGGRVGLETTRGEAPRAFRDPGKAIAVLHGLGARKVDVDTGNGSPGETGAGRRQRPDTAERQRRARAAAAYDAGFRTEVEQALAEADREDSEWVSNEDVMAESRRPVNRKGRRPPPSHP